jgi:hypothetical protein
VTQTAGNAISVVRDALQQLYTIVKPGVDVATPYIQQTADTAYRAALPIATDLEQQAEQALQGVGVDPKPVVDAAKVTNLLWMFMRSEMVVFFSFLFSFLFLFLAKD